MLFNTDLQKLVAEYAVIVSEYEKLKIEKHPENNPTFEKVQEFFAKCDEMGVKMREMLKLDSSMTVTKAKLLSSKTK